jgi:hypothetical protein
LANLRYASRPIPATSDLNGHDAARANGYQVCEAKEISGYERVRDALLDHSNGPALGLQHLHRCVIRREWFRFLGFHCCVACRHIVGASFGVAQYSVRRFARPVPRDFQVAHVIARDGCVYLTVVGVTPFIAARAVLAAWRKRVTARPFPSVFTFLAVKEAPATPNHAVQRTTVRALGVIVHLCSVVADLGRWPQTVSFV